MGRPGQWPRMKSPPPGRHRRGERQPREELRDTLLDTAREVVKEEGIETGTSNLTFKRVFDRVEKATGRRLTNASVIGRIWRNQAEFQADVLMAIARDETRPEVDHDAPSGERGARTGSTSGHLMARLLARRELCRIGGGASGSAIADSRNWSLWISVLTIATTNADLDQRERIGLALAEGYESVTAFWEGIYRWLMDYLGFRPRRPMTVRQFTMAVTALSEGCWFGNMSMVPLPRSSFRLGAMATWIRGGRSCVGWMLSSISSSSPTLTSPHLLWRPDRTHSPATLSRTGDAPSTRSPRRCRRAVRRDPPRCGCGDRPHRRHRRAGLSIRRRPPESG